MGCELNKRFSVYISGFTVSNNQAGTGLSGSKKNSKPGLKPRPSRVLWWPGWPSHDRWHVKQVYWNTSDCVSMHLYGERVQSLRLCVLVVSHFGVPQAIQLSTSSLSKKQAAPSARPSLCLFKQLHMYECALSGSVWVDVCTSVCIRLAFTIACINAKTKLCTNTETHIYTHKAA